MKRGKGIMPYIIGFVLGMFLGDKVKGMLHKKNDGNNTQEGGAGDSDK